MNESKKLNEVWRWKDGVYETTKNMTRDERIVFFNKGLEDLEKKTGLKLRKAKQKEVVGM
ncbi:MAG: hypothetical protein HZA00_06960 [Nitrospinae bacterium]|nr:hypothetical protein [Nitrospinota bacterium]